MTRSHNSYADQCRLAATSQGLDPLSAALDDAGIAHNVEQTGGYVMVLTIPLADGRLMTCTNDSEAGDPDTYLAGVHKSADAWWNGDEDVAYFNSVTVAFIVDLVRA